MSSWTNWSGKLTAQPRQIHYIRSEADARALATREAESNGTIRSVGSAHSHAPLVPTDGVIADTSALTGLISADLENKTVEVWAGTPIYALGRPLHEAGLALINQGDIDRQSIGGAVATGTHGTGQTLGSLSTSVVGATIATSAGQLVTCSQASEPELWKASQLNLGALGIITRLRLKVTDAYCLRERGWTSTYNEITQRLGELSSESRHFEFFWFPRSDAVVAKAIDVTPDAAEYPTAAEGSRVVWSYEVFPNERLWPHTEMEYSVGASDGPGCLGAVRELFQTRFPDVKWAVEYRTVAADDIWLSTAFERPTVTISIHMDAGEDDGPLFGACEEIFRSFGGRPHWGKVNSMPGADLAAHYRHWADWWRVRDEIDPSGTFLNTYLESLR
jgi:FAD/FMN-containing dehydrogenase